MYYLDSKKLKIWVMTLLVALGMLGPVSQTYAAPPNPTNVICSTWNSAQLTNPSPFYIVCPFVRMLNIVTLFAGGVFVVMLLLTAYKYATSMGDPKALQGAKGTGTNAIIGFLIILFLWTSLLIIGRIFDLDLQWLSGSGPFDFVTIGFVRLLCALGTDIDPSSPADGIPHDICTW